MSGSALSDMLVETESIGASPIRCRSSGVSAIPARSAAAADRIFTSRPSMRIAPPSAGARPNSASASFVRPGADDAVKPDDLARAHSEGDRPEGAVAAQIANLQAHLARRRADMGKQRRQIPADHRANEGGLRPFAGRRGCDLEAVAQDGDAVGYGEDFVELVGDVDDRRASRRSRPTMQRARASRGS